MSDSQKPMEDEAIEDLGMLLLSLGGWAQPSSPNREQGYLDQISAAYSQIASHLQDVVGDGNYAAHFNLEPFPAVDICFKGGIINLRIMSKAGLRYEIGSWEGQTLPIVLKEYVHSRQLSLSQ